MAGLQLSASSYVTSLFLVAILVVSCCYFCALFTVCGRRCGRFDPLVLLRLVTTVEHEEEGYQHITDVVTNYGHGESTGRMLG